LRATFAVRVTTGSLDTFWLKKAAFNCRFLCLKFVAFHDRKAHNRLHGRRPRPVRDRARRSQFVRAHPDAHLMLVGIESAIRAQLKKLKALDIPR
jgi:hypothetical protein